MKTLKDCILSGRKEFSGNILAKTSEREFTYDEVITKSTEWSAFLVEKGVKVGDRVGLITPKSLVQLKALYSIWMIGGIALPINEGSKSSELKFILEDATPNVILTTPKLAELVRENYSDVEIIILEELDELSKGKNIDLEKIKITEEDVSTLIYTSGSTGNPKGVMLTHKNLLENGQSVKKVKKLVEDDCLYSILPYWHSFSLAVEVAGTMCAGASIGFTENQRTFVKDMLKFNPSIVMVVPRILEMIKINIEKQIKAAGEEAQGGYEKFLQIAPFVVGKTSDFIPNKEYKPIFDMIDEKLLKKIRMAFGTNFKEFISGGAGIDINLQQYFMYIGLPVMQGYGLSESSPVVCVDDKDNYTLGSSGVLLSWLLEENGGGITFLDKKGNRGIDLKGELLLKGDCIMKGYWNHSDESAKAIKDGWLHTGDIGYYKEGKLYISGRQTNMIVLKGGENVHPEHIENELKKSDMIDDVMIIGDGYKNLYACLTVPEHYDEMHELELKTLLKSEIKRLTTHLSPFQKPRDLLVVPRFSVEDGTYTGTLKVRRHKVNKRDQNKIEEFLKEVGEK